MRNSVTAGSGAINAVRSQSDDCIVNAVMRSTIDGGRKYLGTSWACDFHHATSSEDDRLRRVSRSMKYTMKVPIWNSSRSLKASYSE